MKQAGMLNRGPKRLGPILFWMGLWFFLSFLVNSPLLLPGPLDVFRSLIDLAVQPDFYLRLASSSLRILSGFLIAFIMGIACAHLSWRFPGLEVYLRAPVQIMRAIPMASFVILALFWLAPIHLSLVIPLVVVFPLVYTNALEAFRSTPPSMLEFSQVFRLSSWEVFRAILVTSAYPQILAGAETGMGMAWKSGITAEIIAMAAPSIGEALFDAKLYLDLAGLLAWTFVLILLAAFFQKLFHGLLHITMRALADLPAKGPRAEESSLDQEGSLIEMTSVGKSFEKGRVLDGVSYCFQPGSLTILLGPSGVGKTTLTRLLLGLDQADEGEVGRRDGLTFSAAFQEDRLIPSWTVRQNLRLVAPKHFSGLNQDLISLDLEGEGESRVDALSGGMKQRVSLLRAGLAPADFLIIDEPFRGLDRASRDRTWTWLRERAFPRFQAVLLVFHDPEDLEALMLPQDSAILSLEESGKLEPITLRKSRYDPANNDKKIKP